MMAKNKIKILLAVFVAGGILHLIFDKGQLISNNFDRISTYMESDPLEYVLANTAIHLDGENHSTLSYLSSDATTGIRDPPADIILNGNDTDDGDFSNTTYPLTLQRLSLESCPLTPPRLVGPIRVWMDAPTFSSLEKLYPYVEKGGHGQPKECRSRHRVAIVVPYRDRESHLRIMLHNLHSLLTKQQLDYAIIVVEQVANQTFNRAKLMNVGFTEGLKLYPWQCFIFHDVDLLPEDDRNLYSCPTLPRHMSVAVDKFNYQLPYSAIFGGISAMTVEQLQSINGFSNRYWGWGGEDDDLAERVSTVGYKIARYPAEIARYKMIKHAHEAKSNPVNSCRYKLMARTKKDWKNDGLNSLKYRVIKVELLPLYTHIVVDLLENNESSTIRRAFKC
ncbi:N-acetyllactosaminide 3-alpha-galactosyltransferase [Trichostrongylus colubriformis]|uniref:Beta-1,4-N-acetylgalactosaminyltransferase n=1 Tax=Trichostrongylus colubriformis TaxID=6319 RepID=A0AAN8FUH7_TRICO